MVLGASHNPSVISSYFLQKSEILKDFTEVDESSLIITPAVSQIIFRNQTSLQLVPERLTLTSPGDSDHAAIIADHYCKTLPYIKGTGIGINFVYDIQHFDFSSWFNNLRKVKYEKAVLYSVDIKFPFGKFVCMVKVIMVGPSQGNITFNFHLDLPSTILGEIKLVMVDEKRKCLPIAAGFINEILKD